MKRPAAIRIAWPLLSVLTLAGIGDAFGILTGGMVGQPSYLGVFTAVYAFATGAAAVGLWRMQVWSFSSCAPGWRSVWSCS